MRIWMPLAAVLCTGALTAQAAETPTNAEIRQQFYQVTNDIRRAVDRMPESNFDFKPTPEMRSFRELVAHIADVQNSTCSAVFQDKKSSFAAPKTMSKADLASALGNSFTACYQAFAGLSQENAGMKVSTPEGQQTRLGALAMVVEHNNEEYGYMAVYLRLKGLTPPSSDAAAGKNVKETTTPAKR